MYNCGSWKTTVPLYNTKDHAIVIKKETTVAQIKFLKQWLQMVQQGPFKPEGGPKKAVQNSPSKKKNFVCKVRALSS